MRGRKPALSADPETPQTEIGPPPERLSDDAKEAWREIVDLAPPGVLARSDRLVIEIAATLLAEFRQGPAHPLGAGMSQNRLGRLVSILGDLALTPISRHRIMAAMPSDDIGSTFGR